MTLWIRQKYKNYEKINDCWRFEGEGQGGRSRLCTDCHGFNETLMYDSVTMHVWTTRTIKHPV